MYIIAAMRIQELMANSLSDVDSQSESSFSRDGMLNGNAEQALDFSPMMKEGDATPTKEGTYMLPEGIMFQDGMIMKKKRGRKRKIDKLLEVAATAAASGQSINVTAPELVPIAPKKPWPPQDPGMCTLKTHQNLYLLVPKRAWPLHDPVYNR